MEAAAAMDFHALSRRELQALCKRNGVRANMTNAAMAEALQVLASVDGIDEIGTTLCLPTPARSAMKSAAKMAELAEEQQHGSPLPRSRRVSVKSPEAIRMEVEEGEDGMKRDLVKEIVRTPGVALRSTSRRARATPAPLPTPVPASSARATTTRAPARKAEEVASTPATLRRSQRTAARKAAAPTEEEQPTEDVSVAKRSTRSTKSRMTMALDQEEEEVAAASKEEEKVQQEEPKAVASDVQCDDPDEDEVTKLLEGDSKEEEAEEGHEADSSDADIGSAVRSDESCDDKMEEVMVVMEEGATKPQEGIAEEKEQTSVEKTAPLATMEDSPILGVLSKSEASEPVIEKAQDATLEDYEGCAEWSPVTDIADEIDAVIADKEVSVDEEAIKEDGCTITGETDNSPEEILPTAAEEDETSEDGGLTEVKEGAADEMPQAGLEDDEISEEDGEDDFIELEDEETSEEDDLTELKEGAVAKMLHPELADDETSEEDEEWASDDAEASEEINSTDESDEEADETDEETDTADVVLQGTVIDDAEASEEINSTDESDEEADQTDEETDTADVVHMLQGTVIAEEVSEDASTEDDDFSGDLPPEFDNVAVFNDSDAESDIAAPVLEENRTLVASATKTAVKSLDDSAITEEQEQEADATEKAMKEVDNIVKSLDEFTIKAGEAEEMQKLPQVDDFESMSLRKLQATYKERLIASKAGKEVAKGKRLPLEEVDENACGDC
ncbi:helicase swr-1 [Panicum miliaceum]|uniref:Helicase swr-1 n=1 Tax=Panicum miliaceum TaxID=4540 RepID=A0A3L6RR44_PANMI|nr:helicase swr-1 [Panicum miliaceum]